MCLSQLTKEKYNPKHGWKVFVKVPPGFGFDMRFEFRPENEMVKNVWIKARRKIILTLQGEPYATGFHCFKTREDARLYKAYACHLPPKHKLVIKKVLVRGVETFGVQYFCDIKPILLSTFVASEILIEDKGE